MTRPASPGNLILKWKVAAPASLVAPTVAEFTGADFNFVGVKNAEAMAEMNGFDHNAASQEVPDFVDNVVGTIPGDVKQNDGEIIMYSDDTTNAVFAGIVKGAVGYVLYAPRGAAAGKPSVVWPATVLDKFWIKPDRSNPRYRINLALGSPSLGTIA